MDSANKTKFRKIDDKHTMWFKDFCRNHNRKFKDFQRECARGFKEFEDFHHKCALRFEELQNEHSLEYLTKFKDFQQGFDLGFEEYKKFRINCNLKFKELQDDCNLEFIKLHSEYTHSQDTTSSVLFRSKTYPTLSNFSNTNLNDGSFGLESVQIPTSETNCRYDFTQYSNPQQLIQKTSATSEQTNKYYDGTQTSVPVQILTSEINSASGYNIPQYSITPRIIKQLDDGSKIIKPIEQRNTQMSVPNVRQEITKTKVASRNNLQYSSPSGITQQLVHTPLEASAANEQADQHYDDSKIYQKNRQTNVSYVRASEITDFDYTNYFGANVICALLHFIGSLVGPILDLSCELCYSNNEFIFIDALHFISYTIDDFGDNQENKVEYQFYCQYGNASA
ncbi:5373_t:CDS:2 [Cetraspora pellucida]|uniref:5373_t:CDS:1 n=1 Tax=Cetraspora pellucida TaxID=1433469 RepID=A0ACA9KML4_9GLOM|nr:5373_t:CDS:2 [Cetraspora pellucida]